MPTATCFAFNPRNKIAGWLGDTLKVEARRR
jgi:hypothetical protein